MKIVAFLLALLSLIARTGHADSLSGLQLRRTETSFAYAGYSSSEYAGVSVNAVPLELGYTKVREGTKCRIWDDLGNYTTKDDWDFSFWQFRLTSDLRTTIEATDSRQSGSGPTSASYRRTYCLRESFIDLEIGGDVFDTAFDEYLTAFGRRDFFARGNVEIPVGQGLRMALSGYFPHFESVDSNPSHWYPLATIGLRGDGFRVSDDFVFVQWALDAGARRTSESTEPTLLLALRTRLAGVFLNFSAEEGLGDYDASYWEIALEVPF